MEQNRTEHITKNQTLNLEITDVSSEGKGIAKYHDFIIFIDKVVPGDIIEVKIIRKKKNYAEGKLLKIISESPERIKPKCTHFQDCNGCRYQNIDYRKQLALKQKSISDSFQRIGQLSNIILPEIKPSAKIFYYRNKIEFTFSSNKWLTEMNFSDKKSTNNFALGFHKQGFIDKIIDIQECFLQSEKSNQILNFTKNFFKSRNSSIYSTRTHEGLLRFLVIRQTDLTDETMVYLLTSYEDKKLMEDYTTELINNIPNITSVINGISEKKAQVAQSEKDIIYYGKGFITEYIGKYKFNIAPSAFFQTNTSQVKVLFDLILELAEFQKEDSVLDLYCGSGAISLYISEYVKSVYGVELNIESIISANENKKLNNITNCFFEARDVKEYLMNLLITENRPAFDSIILDPPRSGLHPKSLEYLNQLSVPKMIYVSCNPSTQARDLKILSEKYQVTKIQPVDMFPQTNHVENVVRLDLKKEN